MRVIQEVAERLTLCVRPYDTVARLEDDQFALVMPNLGAPHNAGIVGQWVLKGAGASLLSGGRRPSRSRG